MYPVLGDQDFSPPGQARPQADPLYLAAAELWQTWLPPKAIDTFKLGQLLYSEANLIMEEAYTRL